MGRVSTITCDYCTSEIELEDDELIVERGWLEVAKYDSLRDEIIHLDFCCEECLNYHFQ